MDHHFSSHFGDLLLLKLRARIRSPRLLEDAFHIAVSEEFVRGRLLYESPTAEPSDLRRRNVQLTQTQSIAAILRRDESRPK